MLRKLIKYEFKATGRFMFLMYGLLIALSAIISMGIGLNVDMLMDNLSEKFQLGSQILNVFIVLIIISFVVMNFIVLSGMFFYAVKRFKDNILGDEGYLMHTLPVKKHSIIISKCTVSVIWTVISCIVVIFSFILLLFGMMKTDVFEEFAFIISQIQWSAYDTAEIFIDLFEFVFQICVFLVQSYLHIYASMAVGFSSDTHRTAKSIGVYVLITIITGIFESVMVSSGFIQPGSDTVFSLLCIVAYYLITFHFLSKKLNLQ